MPTITNAAEPDFTMGKVIKEINHPFSRRVAIGIKHSKGLNTKLTTSARTFFRKMNIKVETWKGRSTWANCLRELMSTDIDPKLSGVKKKPEIIPTANKQMEIMTKDRRLSTAPSVFSLNVINLLSRNFIGKCSLNYWLFRDKSPVP